MSDKEWLSEIKAGDQVIVDPGHNCGLLIYTVDKITATQIVVGTWRFRKKDGYRIGDSGYGGHGSIRKTTLELLESIRRRELVRYITGGSKRLVLCPMDLLEHVVTVMKSANPVT